MSSTGRPHHACDDDDRLARAHAAQKGARGRLPVDIKHAVTGRHEWAGLFTALERLEQPVGAGAVLCFTSQALPVTREMTALRMPPR